MVIYDSRYQQRNDDNSSGWFRMLVDEMGLFLFCTFLFITLAIFACRACHSILHSLFILTHTHTHTQTQTPYSLSLSPSLSLSIPLSLSLSIYLSILLCLSYTFTAYANLDCWVALLLSYYYFLPSFFELLFFSSSFFSSPLCVCQECACAKSLIVHNQELDVTLPVPGVR